MPPAQEKREYRYMGSHGIELEVGETRPQVGFGDFIELSADDIKVDSTKELIKAGVLVDTDKMPEPKVAEVQALAAASEEQKEGGTK